LTLYRILGTFGEGVLADFPLMLLSRQNMAVSTETG